MLKRSKCSRDDVDRIDVGYEQEQMERRIDKTEAMKDLLRHRGSYIEMLFGFPRKRISRTAQFKVDLLVSSLGKRGSTRSNSNQRLQGIPLTMWSFADDCHGFEFGRSPLWSGQLALAESLDFPDCSRLQVILRSAEDGSVVKVFLVSLDFSDMPSDSHTIIRQTSMRITLHSRLGRRRDLAHALQFPVQRQPAYKTSAMDINGVEKVGGTWKEGRIQLNGRIRVVTSLSSSASLLLAGEKPTFPTGVEEFLEVTTHFPENPKYYPNHMRVRPEDDRRHNRVIALR